MKIKRFVLFTFNQYYPAGGWGDQIGSNAKRIAALKGEEPSGEEGKG